MPRQTTDTASIRWGQVRPADCPKPLVHETAYVECKLEHPNLEPTAFGDSFFPDAVPYQDENCHRVFYWRPVLDAGADTRDIRCVLGTFDFEPFSHNGFFDAFERRAVVTDARDQALFFGFLARLDCRCGTVVDPIEPVDRGPVEIPSSRWNRLSG
jgi:hypothetical protein